MFRAGVSSVSKRLKDTSTKNQKCSGAKLDVLCSLKIGAVFSALTGIDIWMELTTCSHGSSCFAIPGQVKDFLNRSVHAHSKRFTRTTR